MKDFQEVTNRPRDLRRAAEIGGLTVNVYRRRAEVFGIDKQLVAGLILGAVLTVATLALCGALHPSAYEWAMGVGQ